MKISHATKILVLGSIALAVAGCGDVYLKGKGSEEKNGSKKGADILVEENKGDRKKSIDERPVDPKPEEYGGIMLSLPSDNFHDEDHMMKPRGFKLSLQPDPKYNDTKFSLEKMIEGRRPDRKEHVLSEEEIMLHNSVKCIDVKGGCVGPVPMPEPQHPHRRPLELSKIPKGHYVLKLELDFSPMGGEVLRGEAKVEVVAGQKSRAEIVLKPVSDLKEDEGEIFVDVKIERKQKKPVYIYSHDQK